MVPMGFIHEEHCAACNSPPIMWHAGSQDPSSTGLHKKRAPCRYYQTGNCRRGSGCPFAHISVATQVETLAISHPAYQADHMYTYYLPGQTPVYHPLTSPANPAFLWQPYPPLSPSFDPRYRLARQAETPTDYPDDKSDPSSAESSSTGTSIDYQLRMALDTAWSKGAESGTVRGIASLPGDLRINSSPGYAGYSYPFFPEFHAEHAVGRDRATSGQYNDQGSMAARSSPFLLTCQDDMKKRPLAYKTKQCKFYAASGKCTSGEKCTFIHDPESKGNAEMLPTALSPPTDAQLPPKPRDKYDDCRARDYYPIAWRVIGGGVMMGGQRQICPAFAAGRCKHGNDCKLAHETELETDQVGFIEPKNELVGKSDRSRRQPQKDTTSKHGRSGSQIRKSIKVPPLETQPPVKFPSTTPHPQRPNVPALEETEAAGKKGDRVVVPSARESPTSPVHRRTQSMSMVLTSPAPADAPPSNYAAEL